jgi:enoyl-CoA hydratase/carnithine racemase
MLFLGDRYDAADLAELGVAWRVVPDDRLLDEARAVARHLAGLPPLAARAMKRVLYEGAITDLRRALAAETEATVAGLLDPETTRRMRDF